MSWSESARFWKCDCISWPKQMRLPSLHHLYVRLHVLTKGWVLPGISESLSRGCGIPSVPVYHSHHSSLVKASSWEGRKNVSPPYAGFTYMSSCDLILKKTFTPLWRTQPVEYTAVVQEYCLSKSIRWFIHLNRDHFTSSFCSFWLFNRCIKWPRWCHFCAASFVQHLQL